VRPATSGFFIAKLFKANNFFPFMGELDKWAVKAGDSGI
jgi:hypothetical protein